MNDLANAPRLTDTHLREVFKPKSNTPEIRNPEYWKILEIIQRSNLQTPSEQHGIAEFTVD